MIRRAKLSHKGTKNVAIYAFSSGKFLDDKEYACVNDLTNIVSVILSILIILIIPIFWIILIILTILMIRIIRNMDVV